MTQRHRHRPRNWQRHIFRSPLNHPEPMVDAHEPRREGPGGTREPDDRHNARYGPAGPGRGPAVRRGLGGWLLREGFPRRLLAGLAVSFAGAVVVGLSESGGGNASLLGVGMCLLAAVSYATAVVGQKPALRHASALQVTTFGCFAGTVA